MMKLFRKSAWLPLTAALLFATSCGAQIVPSSWQVTLTWTIPAPAGSWAGCVVGQVTCVYVISRATIPAGTTTCPSTDGTAYVPLNVSNPATGTVYNDATASGLTVCYIAQTVQGSGVSVASNSAGPFVVPGNPLPPKMQGNLAARNNSPQIAPHGAQLAKVEPYLTGRVTR